MPLTISFEVETGSASATATSYASIIQFQQYCLDRGIDASAAIEDQIKVYLNNATKYIDLNYIFLGFRVRVTKSATLNKQALEWPRYLSHILGRPFEFLTFRMIQATEVPDEIIEATCYLASIYMIEGALEYIDKGEKDFSIGPVRISYNRRKGHVSYPVVDGLLRYLITTTPQGQRVR